MPATHDFRPRLSSPRRRSAVSDSEFRRLLGLRLCIGNRWKCDNGHEWVTAHCDAAWFAMPTTCPECGQTATAHRGEWQTLEQWSNAPLERSAVADTLRGVVGNSGGGQ